MKLIIVACMVAVAFGDVSHLERKNESSSEILKHELHVSPSGNYQWYAETDNGIQIGAKGQIDQVDAETFVQRVQGSADYTAPNGEPISLTYVADENGYQPRGAHLPTPPPIPEIILRALEYIRKNPPAPEN